MSNTRIYVACLASYNNGTLHGAWIDCDGKDADELQTEVSAMLRASPHPNVEVECPDCDEPATVAELCDAAYTACATCGGSGKVPSAEEFAIHDYEGFGEELIGEYSSLADVALHAAQIEKHGRAWIGYCNHVGADYAVQSPEGFDDTYQGSWDSEEEFTENLVEDLGILDEMPENLRCYFNYQWYARDLFIGDYWRDDATGAVFSRR